MSETSINTAKCNRVKNDKVVYGEEIDSRWISA